MLIPAFFVIKKASGEVLVEKVEEGEVKKADGEEGLKSPLISKCTQYF